MLLETLFTTDNLIALLTLTALEIVLGIDNIVFIAILTSKLDEPERSRARKLGLALALITRLALLFTLSWIMGLSATLFTVFGNAISWRDIILLVGGLFLLAKATFEIHERIDRGVEHPDVPKNAAAQFGKIVVQIMVLDIVFSLDSVITAVGMVSHVEIMAIAVVLAVIVMLAFSGPVSGFIERHPTMKILALSFLMLIGVMLVADAFDAHIERGYIYFAMGFSLAVELINLRVRGGKADAPKKSATP
ncbi:MAG: TerC family protein [Planctomycetes bacterium]|nr:TerC family protein [Planctomycetota bacterium]NUQ34046.1 TerC family protein [Planctomycetaceae bacterium]